jgi:2-polyprenyl-3-methyl-5-hydroxy-6-metoxy-1,4-benzoquinol methylase
MVREEAMSQQGWNRLATEFEDSVCDITATSGAAIGRLIKLANPGPDQTLVDAGCGIGTFVERFGKSFGNIVAFDFASAMVKRARQRCADIKHAEWHALPLERAGEKYGPIADFAACLNVITSPQSTLRRRQWESLAQLVLPGGNLLVVVPSLESAQYVASVDDEAFHGSVEEDDDLVRRNDSKQKHYARAELRRIIAQLGFDIVTLRKISYPWADDGLELMAAKSPWDWACLARKLV